MDRNTSFSLDDRYCDFIEQVVSAGRYRSASEVVQLVGAIERHSANPVIGRAGDDIRPGYRKLAAGSHVLFYRTTADGVVDVIRVLHRRMDVDRHL